MFRNTVCFIIAALLLMGVAEGAVIHGSIYDTNLEKVGNVVVEVDSEPHQRMISKDGWYSFTLNSGTYTLTAKYKDNETSLVASENIDVEGDGDFVLDIFLFPDLDEVQGLIDEGQNITVDSELTEDQYIRLAWTAAFVVLGLSLLGVFGFVGYIYWKKKKIGETKKLIESGELDEELNQLIEFVRKEGGRATQKDIRKNFPQSEAKISLMITDLEHKGYLEKIKKGRGNVIILKR